ncbi:DUF3592 domain-containing protein [Paenibacillus sp. SEL1]|uniref:DUF3592 domain-containing protein n=1 Tax=Paenibacillus TaxID=44249 RepID=UPI002024F005|nr:DUF3592 domain-containing protein [Paenibacillus polymyxa]URJ39238.1 DUF3592 domain-containing protein [Paenibacillus polymyxa]
MYWFHFSSELLMPLFSLIGLLLIYSTNLSLNRVGSKIKVLYNPSNPRDARIAGGVNGAGCLAFMLFLIGVPFALSGVFAVLKFFF